MNELYDILGTVAACVMPFFNLPMMIHMIRRKSSNDISLSWLFGIWGCLVAMLPAGLISPDSIFKLFTIMNVIFFTAVVLCTLKYRTKQSK